MMVYIIPPLKTNIAAEKIVGRQAFPFGSLVGFQRLCRQTLGVPYVYEPFHCGFVAPQWTSFTPQKDFRHLVVQQLRRRGRTTWQFFGGSNAPDPS